MDNPEEVLHCLDEFAKLKPKNIPGELEDYLMYVARTGDPVYQWPVVKCLFREKLLSVITEFYETTPTLDLPQSPNVDPFNYETMKTVLLERLEAFSNAPFTVQRLCELLTTPRREYNRPDKFMRAIEKNILVVSTREPGNACRPDSALSEPLPNGVSDVPEPPVNATANEGCVTEEISSSVSKEVIGNHVSSISTDQSNHIDSEQSATSPIDSEAFEVNVDDEAKDSSKPEDATEETATTSALMEPEPSSASEVAETLDEKTSEETSPTPSNDDTSVNQIEPSPVSLSSTSSDPESDPESNSESNPESKPEEVTEEASESCKAQISQIEIPSPSESISATPKDPETEPVDSLEASLEPSKPETSTESAEIEKVSESKVFEPDVVVEPPQSPEKHSKPENVPKVSEDVKSPIVEEVKSEPSSNVAADISNSDIPAVDTFEPKDESTAKIDAPRVSIGIEESDSKVVISENLTESVPVVTNVSASEEAVSVAQALDEAMDVDESSNQLVESEAMAVTEEGEPMDDSEQSPTEEMTVCPQLTPQEK